MSVSSAFLWRFLEDVWDLLPTEDRSLFQAYWSAQLQIAANLEQKTIEAGLSTEVANVPVFLTERWERFLMNEDNCDLFTQTDAITLIGTSEVSLSRETALYDTAVVSAPSGQIYHEETIRFFDNAVRELRYGKIVKGTLSISLLGHHTEGTGGVISAYNTLTKAGAFGETEPGMILKVTAATPGNPIGIYRIRAVPDENTVLIYDSFPVAAATGVAFEIDSDLLEYTANRDYAANLEEGTVQALDEGRIPPTELLIVRYQHREYTEDLDYQIDRVRGTVRRVVGTSIADGGSVAVSYTYNNTATLPMEGSTAAVSFATLTDTGQDFSTLLENRTLTIKSGPNAGTYAINAVLSSSQIQIAGSFPVDQETDVEYSINAFPHGIKVAKNIASIPYLQNLVDDPDVFFVEDVDYVVRDGILAVRSAFPLSGIGPSDIRERQMWAEVVKVDRETPYRNFGVLIDFYRENSEAYKLALQGLWYTFWTGSTPGNLRRGLHILLGLPYARKAGTVTRVDTDTGEIDITDPRGQIITYLIPSGLDPEVEEGDSVARFAALTTGVQVIDRNNEPGFVATRLGRAGIERFLTDNASRGAGATDETKALELLEHHLFLPQVLTEAITQRINVGELVTFLDNMKPEWTEYIFSFYVEESDSFSLSESLDPLAQAFDLTATVGNNQLNQAAALGDHRVLSAGATYPWGAGDLIAVSRTTGRILAGGTQATGNFQDSGINFVDAGIDYGDYVFILEGTFFGAHLVLKRISGNTLSLDIPDASISPAANLDYYIVPSERMLDQDAVNVRGEHVVLPGTEFLAPTSFNTKTDVNLSGFGLVLDDLKALLLLDILSSGTEVQAITDGDPSLSEFDVATPPPTAVRAHEIASVALKRTNNLGPTVTDVYGI